MDSWNRVTAEARRAGGWVKGLNNEYICMGHRHREQCGEDQGKAGRGAEGE